MVCRMPSLREILGVQPSDLASEESSNLRNMPSGLVVSHLILPWKLASLAMFSASVRIVTSVPAPVLISSGGSSVWLIK